MTHIPLKRRAFLGGSAMSAIALAQATSSSAAAGQTSGTSEAFTFEITRTDAEWRDMLTKPEYVVLRKGSTELPKTNPNWNRAEKGTYSCRGCDLTIYDSVWKVQLDKGWAFFSQSRENSVLMGTDGEPPFDTYGVPVENRYPAMIEAHCRRCGSHLGHILNAANKTLHCIDGIALQFHPAVV